MNFQLLLLLVAVIAIWLFKRLLFEIRRKQRRNFYRNEYLKSDEWRRKRYVVLNEITGVVCILVLMLLRFITNVSWQSSGNFWEYHLQSSLCLSNHGL